MSDLAVDGLALRRATAADVPAIQAVLEDDAATWELLEGTPLVVNEAELMLTLVPPGGTVDHKHLFVADGACVIDLYAGYPEPQIWYLGLIFLARATRGHGLGTRAIEGLATFIRGHGGTALRLGVVAQNADARRFYDRLGFRHVFSKQRTNPNGSLTDLDVLQLEL